MDADVLTTTQTLHEANGYRMSPFTNGAYVETRIYNRRRWDSLFSFSGARAIFCTVAVCICFLLLGEPAGFQVLAQDAGFVLTGTVLDPAARAISNASVVARSDSSGAMTKTTTDQQGKF